MAACFQKSGPLGRVLRWGPLALVLLAVACNRVEHEAVRATPPSVLLVTIDTLRADHVGAYGARFAETASLDALARRGVRFETVVAPTPITLPSHASLLTGMRPPRHGVRHNGSFRLGGELATLAERLRAHGHATGAVVGSVVLAARHGLDRGFDHYDDRVGARKAGTAGYLECSASEVADAALAWLAIDLARTGRTDEARRDEAQAAGLLATPRLGSQLALAEAAAGDLDGARARLAELERRHPGDHHVARARARGAIPQPWHQHPLFQRTHVSGLEKRT